MKKLTNDEIGKLKTNPIFDGLPEELKDTERYAPIEKQLRDLMYSDHTHASMKGFVKCKRCVAKMKHRQDALKELGFAGYAQYLEWKRVMGVIISQQDLHFPDHV